MDSKKVVNDKINSIAKKIKEVKVNLIDLGLPELPGIPASGIFDFRDHDLFVELLIKQLYMYLKSNNICNEIYNIKHDKSYEETNKFNNCITS